MNPSTLLHVTICLALALLNFLEAGKVAVSRWLDGLDAGNPPSGWLGLLEAGEFRPSPAWSEGTETKSISEDAAIGFAVNLTTTVTNSAASITILGTSTGADATSLFSATTTDGTTVQLTTTGSLDRETTSTFVLHLRATNAGGDTSTEANYGDLELTVNIDDVNDNDPVFSTVSKCKEMASGTSSSTSVETLPATDADAGTNSLGATAYSFSVNQQQFDIVPATGEVKVASGLSSGLAANSYNLVIKATDSGTPARSASGTLTVCAGSSCCATCSGGCSGGGIAAVHGTTFISFAVCLSVLVLKSFV